MSTHLTYEFWKRTLGCMDMPNSIFAKCVVLQAQLHAQGIEATIKDCHDLLVAEALERIRAEGLDTVSA
jgi:hypothetical protein